MAPRRSPLVGRLLVLLGLLGCAGQGEPRGRGPTGPLQTGVAAADCAPWDGAATSIYLSAAADPDLLPPPPPYLQLIVYESGADLTDRRVELGRVEPGSGLAARCDSEDGCATTSRGEITFDPRGPDGTLAGSYRLLFAGDTVAGTFIVRWSTRVAICR